MNAFSLAEDFRISSKRLAASTLLVGGSLAWFFLLWNYLTAIFKTFSPVWVSAAELLFYGSAGIAAVVGIFVARRVDQKEFVLLWIILGVLSNIILSIVLGSVFSIYFSVFLGFSLGLGLPTSLGFFAENTASGERARVAGITILVTFILVVVAIVGSSIAGYGLFGTILIIAAVRSMSLAFLLDPSNLEKEKAKIVQKFRPAYRDFFFYLFPWLVFHIAAQLALYLIPATPQFQSALVIGNNLRFPCIAIFGFISGFMADRFGRKQGVIIGLVMLGVGFALLSLMIPFNVIVYFVFSGVAWGSLLAIYLVIPGDLSSFSSREEFYVLAVVVPLIIMGVFPLIPGLQTLGQVAIPFSQVLSVLLFLSVIPILQAKETLSESETRSRKMKAHVEKVAKLVQDSKKTKHRNS